MAGQGQVTQLIDRVARDSDFATALESDPFATLRHEGFDEILVEAERERGRIAELVDRIYEDEAFRSSLEDDPSALLSQWGLPELAVEPLLLVAGAPEDVLERAATDVEAHLLGKKPASVAAVAAVLGTLAFAQQATATNSPAATAQVSNPAVSAQVVRSAVSTQATRSVVSPQVNRAVVNSQVRRAVRSSWVGVDAQRALSSTTLAKILRAQAR